MYLYLNNNHELILNSHQRIIIDSVNIKELLKYKQKLDSCMFYPLNSNLICVLLQAEKKYIVMVHILFIKNTYKLHVSELLKNFKKFNHMSEDHLMVYTEPELENVIEYVSEIDNYDVLTRYVIKKHSLNNYEYKVEFPDDCEKLKSIIYKVQNDHIKLYDYFDFDFDFDFDLHKVERIFVFTYSNYSIATFSVPYFTHIITRLYKDYLIVAYVKDNNVNILKFMNSNCREIKLEFKYNQINLLSVDEDTILYSIGKKVYTFYYGGESGNISELKSIPLQISNIHKKSDILPLNLEILQAYSKVLNDQFNPDISNLIMEYLV